MKKISLKVAVCLLSCSMLFSSCAVGSWGLFKQYTNWQNHMSDSKFVNAIVGFILMPIAGSISLFIDAVILNTIEFWSGDNPVASNVGKTQMMNGKDGRQYAVTTLKNGYKIVDAEGAVTMLLHNSKDDSWSISQNGQTKELFRFNNDKKSIKVNTNGEERDFTLNEQGVIDAKMAFCDALYFAAR